MAACVNTMPKVYRTLTVKLKVHCDRLALRGGGLSSATKAREDWEPVDHLQGSLGPGGLSGLPGPKPRKSLKKSLPVPLARDVSRVWKVSKMSRESRKGAEKTFSRLVPDS